MWVLYAKHTTLYLHVSPRNLSESLGLRFSSSGPIQKSDPRFRRFEGLHRDRGSSRGAAAAPKGEGDDESSPGLRSSANEDVQRMRRQEIHWVEISLTTTKMHPELNPALNAPKYRGMQPHAAHSLLSRPRSFL